MGGTYGQSRAGKMIQDGLYEEAVAEATQRIASPLTTDEEEDRTGHLVDRAAALAALGRHREAAADLEAAMAADGGDLDVDAVDDAYWSALIAEARTSVDLRAGALRLERYREVLPRGQHVGDVTEWQKRLRGELTDKPIIKERA